MFRIAMAFATVVSAVSFAERCDHRDIARFAHKLERSARTFEREVSQDGYFKHLTGEANRLERRADRLKEGAKNNAPCQRLFRDFREDVEPAFENLRNQYRQTENKHSNMQVRKAWREVAEDYRDLAAEMKKPGPGPGPGGNPCFGLQGAYTGMCRSKAGNTAVAFSVGPQGKQCVVYNAQLFQNVALVMEGGKGTAGLTGHPGGVAIQNTSLTVYGQGRFQISGYNSAGKFSFNCAP